MKVLREWIFVPRNWEVFQTSDDCSKKKKKCSESPMSAP